MANVRTFKYYLHDDYDGDERAGMIGKQVGIDSEDDEFWEKVGRPFYEVTLECTLDVETGDVTIMSVNGKRVEA